jgi:hypothetical protein
MATANAARGKEWFTIAEPHIRKKAGFKVRHCTYHLLAAFFRLGILDRRPFGRTHEYKWALPTKNEEMPF